MIEITLLIATITFVIGIIGSIVLLFSHNEVKRFALCRKLLINFIICTIALLLYGALSHDLVGAIMIVLPVVLVVVFVEWHPVKSQKQSVTINSTTKKEIKPNIKINTNLPQITNLSTPNESNTILPLQNIRFCISGHFKNTSHQAIKTLIIKNGGKVTSTVSKLTDYLVCDHKNNLIGKNSNELKAIYLINNHGKIKIINLDDLHHMITKS